MVYTRVGMGTSNNYDQEREKTKGKTGSFFPAMKSIRVKWDSQKKKLEQKLRTLEIKIQSLTPEGRNAAQKREG